MNWVFLAPVEGLELDSSIDREIRLGRVTFIDKAKLPYIRKRLKLPLRISEYKVLDPYGFPNMFEGADTLAMLTQNYTPTGDSNETNELRRKCVSKANEAISLLAACNLVYTRRRHRRVFGMPGYVPRGWHSYTFIPKSELDADGNTRIPASGGHLQGSIPMVRLDRDWDKWQKEQGLFYHLLSLIDGETNATSQWRKVLLRAVEFTGESFHTLELKKAFLWNVFSIETLLSRRGERSKDLYDRLEEFFSIDQLKHVWTKRNIDFRTDIEYLYDVRNKIVHDADTTDLEMHHLLFSDILIMNLLRTILRNVDAFQKQEDLLEFCDLVRAERLLGINHQVPPKEVSLLIPEYTDDDYEPL